MELNIAEEVKKARELEINQELQEMFSTNLNRNPESNLYKVMMELIVSFAKTKDLFIEAYKEKRDTGKLLNQTGYLYNLNYSISISLDYLLTLMNLSNIGDEDVLKYYKTLLIDRKLDDAYYFEGNPLKTVMCYARHNNIERHIYNNPDVNLRPAIHAVNLPDETFLKPGRIIDDIYGELLYKGIAQVIHHISKAYKLIPQGSESNIAEYHEQVMEIWLNFFCLMDLWGNDYDSVGRLYSIINHIKNKYNEE